MTNPVYSKIYCSVCGKVMGKKPGIHVVLGAVCEDPLCSYQPDASANSARDSYIVAAAMDGVGAAQIAASNQMSRQRVYQIVETWKAGV